MRFYLTNGIIVVCGYVVVNIKRPGMGMISVEGSLANQAKYCFRMKDEKHSYSQYNIS